MKLGKAPAVHDPRDLKFAAYRAGVLPARPRVFGHEKLVPTWGMLGNADYGCCVWSGGDHETMLWNAEAGVRVDFTDQNALSDYAAVTGFTPDDPDTDQGTDMRAALKYRRTTGLVDATGKRHKIGGFVALTPGNTTELLEAAWLFGAVAIGVRFPSSAMAQFNAGKPWSVVSGASIEGGHYIPGVAVRGAGLLGPYADSLFGDAAETLASGSTRDIVVVTWGKLQPMSFGFYEKYADEAYALLSPEMLHAGKSLEGFDLEQLKADLAAIAA